MPYRYETTEAKRYLGSCFSTTRPHRAHRHRTNRASRKPCRREPPSAERSTPPIPLIAGIFPEHWDPIEYQPSRISSLRRSRPDRRGSCHIGEAAGKAGQQINFHVGGEGRGYTDAQGNFFPRRRPQ